MTPKDVGKTITPESRKVLDAYRDSLLGDGVSETARMLIEERIASLEGAQDEISGESMKKLRLDAENVLTWEPPTEGDPLLFAHLRRFAKAVLSLSASRRSTTQEHKP